jgi:hypothetical protein
MAAPPVPPKPEPAAPAKAKAPEPAPAQPAAAPQAGGTRPVNPFLSQDPKQKARRLARALVSDMIVYQPDKRQQAMDAGNLKEAFDDEIKKSWEEYVEQVGQELADSTNFLTEALTEILAGGQQLF